MVERGAVPDDLQAIVIDTNAMGEGRLDMQSLSNLADVLRKKVPHAEIWIPEPVMWEWAAHARQAYEDGVAHHNSTVKRMNQSGVSIGWQRIKDQEKFDVQDDVIRRVESLPAPFKVLRLADHPEIAVDALRAQVTLEPPAKRKGGVKTGAADIAAIRLAETVARAQGASQPYVVISADGDVEQMLEWEANKTFSFPSIRLFRDALLNFVPIELRLLPNLHARIIERIDRIRAGVDALPDVQYSGVDRLLDFSYEPLKIEVDLAQVHEVVALRNIKIDADAAIGSAQVVALADITATAWTMDKNGDELISESETARGMLAFLNATFSLSEGDSTLDFEDCYVSLAQDRYGDSDEALSELVEVLSTLPGFAVLLNGDGVPVVSEAGDEFTLEVNDKTIEVAALKPYHQDGDDWEWSLEVTVGENSASVNCYFEDTWFGGREGMQMEPPYVLGSASRGGIFALTSFLVTEVFGLTDPYADEEAIH